MHGADISKKPPAAIGAEVAGEKPDKYKSNPDLAGFIDYFNSRFGVLYRMIRQKYPDHNYSSIPMARNRSTRSLIFARVRSVVHRPATSRITFDAPPGVSFQCTCNHKGALGEKIVDLISDICIGIDVSFSGKSAVIHEIYWPGYQCAQATVVAGEITHATAQPVWTLVLSDIHFGSRNFMAANFDKMVEYSNAMPNLKYVLIAGDIVQGVGVYPGQEADLICKTIRDQYALMRAHLSKFRDGLKFFVIPGNHDYTPLLEPQYWKQEFKSYFPADTVFLHNPSFFDLSGLKVAMYHGASLDILVASIDRLAYARPIELMEYYLKIGHLAPSYGLKNVNMPLRRDAHVIAEKPDVFITGHIHCHGIAHRGGTLLCNPGTWQAITDFQKRMGLSVQPCQAVYFDVKDTRQFKVVKFGDKSDARI